MKVMTCHDIIMDFTGTDWENFELGIFQIQVLMQH
jgi:hypothetical protein